MHHAATPFALKLATDPALNSTKPYPNDSAANRAARTALQVKGIELRRQIELVAEQRHLNSAS